MIENNISDNDLKFLIESAFQKLEKTEETDSKISAEKSSTLNWILAFTTLFVGMCIQNYKSVSDLCLKEELFISEKILFTFLVIMLILYKIANIKYEEYKKSFLANLHTHMLALLFDIKIKLRPKLTNDALFVPSFINRFRNGELSPDYDNESKKALKIIDKKISIYSRCLKLIYTMTMIAFTINLIITIVMIMNINGG